jgi:hypothetical protein
LGAADNHPGWRGFQHLDAPEARCIEPVTARLRERGADSPKTNDLSKQSLERNNDVEDVAILELFLEQAVFAVVGRRWLKNVIGKPSFSNSVPTDNACCRPCVSTVQPVRPPRCAPHLPKVVADIRIVGIPAARGEFLMPKLGLSFPAREIFSPNSSPVYFR